MFESQSGDNDADQQRHRDAAKLESARELKEIHQKMRDQIGNVIYGHSDVVDQILIAMFSGGHCLLEGVPGLAKTLMISTIAQLLSLTFRRIQFTPDLMPSDITGTEILDEIDGTGRREMRFIRGPVFTNILLGDEINRSPPKTQSALLQSMQEYQVTVAGDNLEIDRPFLVLATQNPIEQEGTYPLPEAQLDRFMFKILLKYPDFQDELRIAETTTRNNEPRPLIPLLDRDDILFYQSEVRDVIATRTIASYAVRLVRATRPDAADAPELVKKYLSWGAGPRAYQAILLGAKARALLKGHINVSSKDIQYIAFPVLRHRLVLSFAADSDDMTTDSIIDKLLDLVPESEP